MTITDADDQTYKALRAKANTRSRSAKNSKNTNRSRRSTRPPSRARSQGAVAIFVLPEEVSSNRPLMLHIPGRNGESGTVKLDL